MEKYYACEEKYLVSYLKNRAKIEDIKINKEAGFFGDLENQVEKMKNIMYFDGNTANIDIFGVLVDREPDIWDALFDMRVVSYKSIRDAVIKAFDMNASKIVVRYDTPGGTVSGVELTRGELRAASELIEMESINVGMCCSAGMWLASSTGNLISNDKTTEAGSIGVVMTVYDDKKYLSDLGIVRHVITNKESTDKIPDISKKDGRDVYQAELDQFYDVFANNVVEGFGIGREKIDSLKGRVLIGDNAVEYGLMINKEGEQKINPENNNNNPVEIKEKTEVVMSVLQDFLKSNPEAQAEYEKDLDSARSDERTAVQKNTVDILKLEKAQISKTAIEALENNLTKEQYAVKALEVEREKRASGNDGGEKTSIFAGLSVPQEPGTQAKDVKKEVEGQKKEPTDEELEAEAKKLFGGKK